MRRFSEIPGDVEGQAEQMVLDRYPEPRRDEPVYIAISVYGPDIYHWRIAWKAYYANSQYAGWKVIEVIIPTGGYSKYQYRYSFKAKDMESIKDWDLFYLGKVDHESRDGLGLLGGYEPPPRSPEEGNADGGCVSCVEGFLKELVKAGTLERATVATAIVQARQASGI